MKTVLLIVSLDTHFTELSRVARTLSAFRKYKPVIWFLHQYPTFLRDVDVCRSEGWEFTSSSPLPSSAQSRPTLYKSWKRFTSTIPRKVRELPSWFYYIQRFLRYRNRIKVLVQEMNSHIRRYKPDLMVVCEENVGYSTHILIRICWANGIGTLIVPYTIANATEAAEYYYNIPEHQVSNHLISRFVAKKFPYWVYEHRGRKLLRLPPLLILALEQLGYRPAHPWILNSEETAIIAVENEHMLEYYRSDGLPENRLIVTGALYDDVLAESVQRFQVLSEKLIAELGLNKENPILLCALPPSQFPRDCEFADYESLLSFWMESLSQVEGWNLIIRPHPRVTEEQINKLKRFGLKISNWDTASLVPLCDLYVASVSATIRWAIACGKPVVNYDVYQMNYSDYKNVGGVLTIFSKTAFEDTIKRLTSDPDYYEKLSALQLQEMSKWGCLDGKSSERMMKLFDDLIDGKIRRKPK